VEKKLMVASTGSAIEESYEQNAVVELVETSAVEKTSTVVASTGSATEESYG